MDDLSSRPSAHARVPFDRDRQSTASCPAGRLALVLCSLTVVSSSPSTASQCGLAEKQVNANPLLLLLQLLLPPRVSVCFTAVFPHRRRARTHARDPTQPIVDRRSAKEKVERSEKEAGLRRPADCSRKWAIRGRPSLSVVLRPRRAARRLNRLPPVFPFASKYQLRIIINSDCLCTTPCTRITSTALTNRPPTTRRRPLIHDQR